VVIFSAAAAAQEFQISITATADEQWGPEPDLFGLLFTCSIDARIIEIIYDLSTSAGDLTFDTEPHNDGAYFPTLLGISSDVGASAMVTDGSQELVFDCTDFQPGEILYFAADVDGTDCTTFSAADFAGTYLGIIVDPSPEYGEEADPVGVVLWFEDINGMAIATGGETGQIPEPTTLTLFAGGAAVLAGFRRRRIRRA
jgi:hypothetical protein